MDQIHLSPLVDQIQLALGHISNSQSQRHSGCARRSASLVVDPATRSRGGRHRGPGGGTAMGELQIFTPKFLCSRVLFDLWSLKSEMYVIEGCKYIWDVCDREMYIYICDMHSWLSNKKRKGEEKWLRNEEKKTKTKTGRTGADRDPGWWRT
jgi:hypothetical protein